jgi:hypothetical protein
MHWWWNYCIKRTGHRTCDGPIARSLASPRSLGFFCVTRFFLVVFASPVVVSPGGGREADCSAGMCGDALCPAWDSFSPRHNHRVITIVSNIQKKKSALK